MTAKEKQGFGLYFLFAFGMAWLCQVGGCMALLQQNNAVLYQLALIVTMFCPLLAVLLVQKAFLRQPTGIGWKVQGKRRFWLAAWFGPAVLTLLDILYEKTESIWVPAIAHGAFNAVAALPQVLVTPADAYYNVLGPMPIGLIAALPMLAATVWLTLREMKQEEKN